MFATSPRREWANKFEIDQIDFRRHVKFTHNIFNYLYYIHYLYMKSPNECTILELEIKQKLSNKDVSWIPYLTTKGLGKTGSASKFAN
jgi:hypothetical protein